MTRAALLIIAGALLACTPPQESGVKVIVGARLEPGPGQAPVEYSVVVVANGKIRAIGPQSAVPVPKGSEITRGLGMTVHGIPGGEPLEPGRPADLVLEGEGQRREMHNGDWVR